MQAFTVLREFILGHNTTGLVVSGPGGDVSVAGGELAALAVDAIQGQSGIAVGSIFTTSTFNYPAATVAAWDAFIATATLATVIPQITGLVENAQGSGAVSVQAAGGVVAAGVACAAAFAVSLFASL